MTTAALKLVFLNVRGISYFNLVSKKKGWFYFSYKNHIQRKTEICWKNKWVAETVMSHCGSNLCGVVILFGKGVDCVIHTKILDLLGHCIILKAAIKDKIYILINIYAPNKDNNITHFFNNTDNAVK